MEIKTDMNVRCKSLEKVKLVFATLIPFCANMFTGKTGIFRKTIVVDDSIIRVNKTPNFLSNKSSYNLCIKLLKNVFDLLTCLRQKASADKHLKNMLNEGS